MQANEDFLIPFMRGAVPEVKSDFERANRATTGNLSGERRLLMALLQDAVEIVQGKRRAGQYGSKKRLTDPSAESRRWIAGDCPEDFYFPVAFEDVCQHLRLDPEAVRKSVLGRPPC